MSEYIFVTNIFEYSNIRIYSSHSASEHLHGRIFGQPQIDVFSVREKAPSHYLHFLCVFSNVSWNCVQEGCVILFVRTWVLNQNQRKMLFVEVVINRGFGPYWLFKLGMYNAHFSGQPQFLEWDQEIFSVFVVIQHISHLPSIGPKRYRTHPFSIDFCPNSRWFVAYFQQTN